LDRRLAAIVGLQRVSELFERLHPTSRKQEVACVSNASACILSCQTMIDLQMLVVAGGRERTAPEYEQLLVAAGFTLGRVFPTPTGPSIIEAIPA
jgi:hypothetical protein